jgi:aspartyl-tRNA synthetase
MVALFVGADSLREVIAFPKTTAARALFEGAPTPLDADDLAELGLSLAQSDAKDAPVEKGGSA